MQKPILLCLFIMLLSITISAQTKVGVLGGINISKLNGDVEPNTKYKSKIEGNFGVFIDLELAKNIFISLQPSYSQEGTKTTHKVDGVYTSIDSIKVKLHYLSIPVLLKVTSTNERFYAIGGIETAKLLNSSQTPTGGTSKPINATVEPWNFSIHFGAGMRLPLGFSTLFIEARYTQGLNNITEDNIADDLLPRVKSSSIKFLTGIEIPLGNSKN
jgi:hypothetical protein